MKKIGFIVLLFILLVISFISLRFSIPFFEINQAFVNKERLITSGVSLNLGGVYVSDVKLDSPAALGGIAINSQITHINGEFINDSNGFLDRINNNRGKPATFTVCNPNICNEIILTPRVNSPNGQGPLGIVIQDVSIYNKSSVRIIYEQLYNRYIGGDFFAVHFGRQTIIVSWATLVIGIISLVTSFKFISKILGK